MSKITITSATTASNERLAIYSLRGEREATHLRAGIVADNSDESDVLFEATAHALQTIKIKRSKGDDPLTIRKPRITIATGNQQVLWAAEFLQDEALEATGCRLVTDLQEQLWRFDVQWQLLRPDDLTLFELKAWAERNFKPGNSNIRQMLTRRDSYQIERSLAAA